MFIHLGCNSQRAFVSEGPMNRVKHSLRGSREISLSLYLSLAKTDLISPIYRFPLISHVFGLEQIWLCQRPRPPLCPALPGTFLAKLDYFGPPLRPVNANGRAFSPAFSHGCPVRRDYPGADEYRLVFFPPESPIGGGGPRL